MPNHDDEADDHAASERRHDELMRQTRRIGQGLTRAGLFLAGGGTTLLLLTDWRWTGGALLGTGVCLMYLGTRMRP